jgi:putative transposase
MVTHATRPEATPFYLQVYEVSQQRACQVIGADRSSVRYRSRRPEDGLLRLRLRGIALRRRFGYHRLHILRDDRCELQETAPPLWSLRTIRGSPDE